MSKFMTDLQFKRKLEEQALKRAEDEKGKQLIQERDKKREHLAESAPILEKHKAEVERKRIQESFGSFKKNLKQALLTECIYNIYKEAIPSYLIDTLHKKGINIEEQERKIIGDFINEEGTNTILRRMSLRNSLLASYANTINETYSAILEKVDEDEEDTMGIELYNKHNFYDELANDTPDDVIEVIKTRVTSAVDSFLDENRKMKDTIMDIYGTAEESIGNAQTESARLNIERHAKQRINEVRNRTISVLGEMVKINAKNVMKDEALREEFTDDKTGRLDVDYVLEASLIEYAFLETVSSLGLVDVDADYINKVLKEMAGIDEDKPYTPKRYTTSFSEAKEAKKKDDDDDECEDCDDDSDDDEDSDDDDDDKKDKKKKKKKDKKKDKDDDDDDDDDSDDDDDDKKDKKKKKKDKDDDDDKDDDKDDKKDDKKDDDIDDIKLEEGAILKRYLEKKKLLQV